MTEKKLKNPTFIHLDVNTEYSIGKSVVRIEQLLDQCLNEEIPAVGIADHGNLFSAYKVYKSAIKKGIKPIIGVTLSVEFESSKSDCKLILLCKDQLGYKNLSHLITRSYIDGYKKDEARVNMEWLNKDNTKGLIAISAYHEGIVQSLMLSDKENEVDKQVNCLKTHFGENFFLGITKINREREEELFSKSVALSSKHQIPLIALNNPKFLKEEEFITLDARVCIDQATVMDDRNREVKYTNQQYFKTHDEMQSLFSEIPEAISNANEVAKMCNFGFENVDHVLPHFDTPENYTIEEYLSEEARKGLSELENVPPDQKELYEMRLESELKIIHSTGFSGYFLIVSDFVKWSRANNIPVGPGRGSGPGSLVAFCLDISDIDPMKYDLIFERFLNPERVSMPDFDIDFCVNGRDSVIQYVSEKYGTEMVSQIITYGTLSAKAVLRDVGRILGYPYGMVDQVAKLIPFDIGITLSDALKKSSELAEKYENDEEVEAMMNLSLKLEGLVRNAGTHAGGVVIAPSNLSDFMPLYKVDEEVGTVTQFDKDDAESIGLIKFDFLGLKTLTVIQKAVDLINKKNNTNLDIRDLPLDDKGTYNLLSSSKTVGIFQLESSGMRDLIKRMKPSKFDDIVALVALFRPGPLQSGMVDDFIERRKSGQSEIIDYLHPTLEAILKPTYGVIVYQEQVMQIAQKLANYSQGSADILRKAMGKKIPEEMAKQKDIFIQGAIKNDVKEAAAKRIFDLIEKFAGYGFNKSHSVSYAMIAYQTAWLKKHHTDSFYAASMSADMDNTDKLIKLKEDCIDAEFHIQILGPCINHSDFNFIAEEPGKIRYALGAIKGIGKLVAESIENERKANGRYRNLFDFTKRLHEAKISKRTLESLIKSGALDCLDENRATLMNSIKLGLNYSNRVTMEEQTGQSNLFYSEANVEESEPKLEIRREWSLEELLHQEYQSLGFYFSGHPFDPYRNDSKHMTKSSLSTLKKMMDSDKNNNGYSNESNIEIAGLIMEPKRRGANVVFKVEDGTAVLDAIIFGEKRETFGELIQGQKILHLKGKLRFDRFADLWQFVAEEAIDLEELIQKKAQTLMIKCDPRFNPEKLKKLLESHTPGKCKIKLNYKNDVEEIKLNFGDQWTVNPSKQLRELLTAELGIDNFQFLTKN